MKKMTLKSLLLLSVLISVAACDNGGDVFDYSNNPISNEGKPKEGILNETKSKTWDFADKKGWVTANQGNDDISRDEIINCTACKDGKAMKIWTKAYTLERKKVRTEQQFGSGRYKWRTYISDLLLLERASIGSWLWHDDKHELDFEVGSGTSAERAAMNLSPDQVIAYVSSQGNPEMYEKIAIKKNEWHTFEIDLKLVGNNYMASWIIDGVTVAIRQLTYGDEFPFHIFCSVENLKFTGDYIATQNNYGLFDNVKYTPYEYSVEPTTPKDPTNPVDPEPEPEPGETIRWGFDGIDIPSGWSRWTSVGEDGVGMLVVKNGYLSALVKKGYPEARGMMNLRSSMATTLGTYTWKVHVNPIDPFANFMTGGQLYPSKNEESKSITLDVMYGGINQRRTQPGIANDEVLLRASSEFWDDVAYKAIKVNQDYILQIQLGLLDNGNYLIRWLVDGEVLATRYTAQFGPKDIKYNMVCLTQNNWGWYGTHFNGVDINRDYYGLFDYAEFTTPEKKD